MLKFSDLTKNITIYNICFSVIIYSIKIIIKGIIMEQLTGKEINEIISKYLEIHGLDSIITEVGLLGFYTYEDGSKELRNQIPCFASSDYFKNSEEKLNYIANEILKNNYKEWATIEYAKK